MRILHISTRLILGGSQENTVLSCEGQARPPFGHEVHLAFGPIYGPEGSLLERVERFNAGDDLGGVQVRSAIHPIRTHVVPNLVREINPLADAQALKELEALIRKIRPDIVHTHSSKAGILGRLAAWRVNQWDSGFETRHSGAASPQASHLLEGSTQPSGAEAPTTNAERHAPIGIIHTIHGPPFMPVEGSLAKRAITAAKNKAYEIAERKAAKRCHLIVSVADAMTRQFLDRGIGAPEQYETVYSGMEVEPFVSAAAGESREQMRTALGLGTGDFVIGTVARLAEHKGHDDLLDALAEDLKANPHWKLLWVGDGWWRERLMARVRELQLVPQVVLAGLVPPERVPGMMRAMDVLVHPSYREGLPRTVPQALLTGVPVVAYDCDGTKEACIPDQTGILVPVGDRQALRAAVRWMYDHPYERGVLGAQGRSLCRDRFSAATMVAHLQRIYERALRRARRDETFIDESPGLQ